MAPRCRAAGAGVVIIGTTTEADFNERMAADPAVAEHMHVVRVPEADEKETVAILAVHKPRLEVDYAIRISDDSLPAAARLARRTSPTRRYPPRPCSSCTGPAPWCAWISRPILRCTARSGHAEAQLDDEDVTLAASLMTGIPASKLGVDERSRYASMVEHLHERIVGQEEAVLAVSRAVKTARVGLKDPNRPIGSFLFLGPTGVGKTELAKALADFMFGTEDAMVVLDMSEYQQEHAVNRLVGAPPGYVGYEGGGQLTERVRARPYTVVLFDEVEKAHPRVLDVLLQMMEEGRLTDGQGRTVSFAETVIILTSNLGAEYLETTELTDPIRELVMERVKQFFRPEFLNRLDEVVLFLPLTNEQLGRILGMLLKKEARLVEERGLRLEISEAASAWMLAQNDHPEWGARPLRRIIQRFLREPLADSWLAEDPPPGTTRRRCRPSGPGVSVSLRHARAACVLSAAARLPLIERLRMNPAVSHLDGCTTPLLASTTATTASGLLASWSRWPAPGCRPRPRATWSTRSPNPPLFWATSALPPACRPGFSPCMGALSPIASRGAICS